MDVKALTDSVNAKSHMRLRICANRSAAQPQRSWCRLDSFPLRHVMDGLSRHGSVELHSYIDRVRDLGRTVASVRYQKTLSENIYRNHCQILT